jgi:WhiB family redox-sensing transcriptional regulator
MSLISLVLLTRRAGALADLEQAKMHCRHCPVRGFCLSGAVERHEPYGVWGGEIFHHGAITAHKKARGRPRAKVA